MHEKETSAKVKDMKNKPIKPLLFDSASILFTNAAGKVISKAPKKESAKMSSKAKNNRLKVALLAASFKAEVPNNRVITKPKLTYMATIKIP